MNIFIRSIRKNMNKERNKIISKIDKLLKKLYIWYDRKQYLDVKYLLSDLRRIKADKKLRVRNAEARRKQWQRIYINTYKDDKLFKSDNKCKSKFEDDHQKEILKFRNLRWEVEWEEEIIECFVDKIDWIKSVEIDRKFEDKMMK